MNSDNRQVLLKVEDLCQYFKSGNSELKAVDGVSFEIYKGEVLGLSEKAAAARRRPAVPSSNYIKSLPEMFGLKIRASRRERESWKRV